MILSQTFVTWATNLCAGLRRGEHQSFAVLGNIAVDMTAYAKNQNQSFPFVTLPDFGLRVGALARIAGLMKVATFPLVQESEREAYEAYTVANQGWKAESCAGERGIATEELGPLPPISPVILNMTRQPSVDEGPYFPFWQLYPCNPLPTQNTDLYHLPHYFGPMSHALYNHEPAMPPSIGYWDNPNSTDWRLKYFRNMDTVDYQDDPLVAAFYPGKFVWC
ncbi:Guanylate cyclase [Seminavis robusta]|uniref:Guanylate cyclase n=1 Tax=Seminavis robusta TaxID=568900 RepID=A0A9N8I1G8_9STRA|nr:Guanylate cyclase [Seminavis robusta]|eukprot:Sro3591_g349400.1 Guanylate cyclase (221) ;mRNA; r:2162-2824